MKTIALLLCIGGCSASVTETLVTVSASGLRVGVDINQLHLQAVDTAANFTGLDQTLVLCPEDAAPPPSCRDLPLSVVLYPGPKSPQDPVRVLVEGLRDNRLVLSSVAVFSFTPGVKKRLDFVLYGTCLNRLDCSGRDVACDANGNCVHLMPMMGESDLAVPGDLSVDDLSVPVDLAGVDLTGADLLPANCGSAGMACCPPQGTCNGTNLACFNGSCQPCGGAGQWCCPDASQLCTASLGCDASFHCVGCGAPGQPCCAGNACAGSSCIFGICQTAGCGGVSQPCCNGACVTGLACVSGVCGSVPCSMPSVSCCSAPGMTYCASGFDCYNGSCLECSTYGQSACPGTPSCAVPFQADPYAGICLFCDVAGYNCCGGANGVCTNFLKCSAGTCG